MTMPNNNNSRILLKRLKKTLSELGEAQARLNKIVKIIADSMNSEVCSIYLINRYNILELYATEGLLSKAVHLLAELTKFACVVSTPKQSVSRLQIIELIKISEDRI